MTKYIVIARSALTLGFAGVLAAPAPASAIGVGTAAAHVRVAKFDVANMTCPTCPITVKAAMSGVRGVRSVKINLASKTATVLFDPKITTARAIAAASTNAGYPAKPRG